VRLLPSSLATEPLKISPITYYIVESDENTIRLIQREINNFQGSFKSLGLFRDFKEAHKRIIRDEPEIVFLNIEFPFFTGAEVFGKVPGKKSDFIFLSKEDNFIFQNIKSGKFDCLLKPISEIELKRTLKRKVEARSVGRPLTYGHYSPASTEYKFKNLHFPTSNGYVFLNPDDIMYCQADVEYTQIVTKHGKHLISKK
jgi:two-component system LytT family response regulator